MSIDGRKRILVVSPHLDDAALSLSVTIARAARQGFAVTVVTVLAGDPTTPLAAGPWDALCGFMSADQAAHARRAEDARACALLGASSICLPFRDEQYDRGGDANEIWAAMESYVLDADLVLLPGHPLTHGDHAWLTRALLPHIPPNRVGLYVEEPYAALPAIPDGSNLAVFRSAARVAAGTLLGLRAPAPPRPDPIAEMMLPRLTWRRIRPNAGERRLKRSAIAAYDSQLKGLGRMLLRLRLYELAVGGERVALPNLDADLGRLTGAPRRPLRTSLRG